MRLRWIVAGVGLVLVLAAAAVLLSANRLIEANRAEILAAAERGLGRPVTVGAIQARLFGRPAVRLSDVSIAEDTAFGSEPFVSAQEATVRLKLWPLLEGRLEVARIGVEQPTVRIVRETDGRFNYATLGAPRAAGTAPSGSVGSGGNDGGGGLAWAVALFDVEGGEVTYVDRMQVPPRTLDVRKIALRASDVSLDEPIRFDLRAAVDEVEENVDVDGEIGPLSSREAVPVALRGSFGPLPGWPYEVEGLDFRGFVRQQTLDVDAVRLSVFGGEVEGQATLPRLEGGSLTLNGEGKGIDLEPLLSTVAPRLRLEVGGRAEMKIDLQGVGNQWPALRESLRGDISVRVADGVLRRFNLVGELIKRLSVVPELDRLLARNVKPKYAAVMARPDTAFESMSAELRFAAGAVLVEKGDLVGEDFGATVSGQVSPGGDADLRGEAQLSKRFSEDIAADVKEARLLFNADGVIAVPFVYRGKLGEAKPEIDAGRAVKGLLQGDLSEVFKKLFK